MSFLYRQLWVKPTIPKDATWKGQTVIVTGSNIGLGLEAARHFVQRDAAKVILAVRNTTAGEAAKLDIEKTTGRTGICEVWALDLASYASVKAFAARATDSLARLDVLLENAGIAVGVYSAAEDNERTITVNVTSTFLLALLLLPKLRSTAAQFNTPAHINIVTSEVHGWTPFTHQSAPAIFPSLASPLPANMAHRYEDSKLLEILIVRQLAPHLTGSGVVLNLINPGLCHSALGRDAGWFLFFLKLFLARTTEVGSRTLVAAAAAGPESHGKYMTDGKVEDEALSPFARGEDGAKVGARVWAELSEILERVSPGVTKNLD